MREFTLRGEFFHHVQCISNHHIVHFRYISILFSLYHNKTEKKKKGKSVFLSLLFIIIYGAILDIILLVTISSCEILIIPIFYISVHVPWPL